MSLLIAFAILASQPAQPQPGSPAAAAIAAKPLGSPAAEEAAIRAAVARVYAVISGPAGQKRDWAGMKTLFTPDARLYAVGSRGLQGGSLDDYISRSGEMLERVGFTESELVGQVQMFGNVAQVWSSYAGTSTDGSVNVRGINSFQLARQPDGRWLVHSILWQGTTPQLPLPPQMERR
nr:nuclear transport factor 2 family protein [uncultured Sphingomonas sp.]